jgi:hypothetical protein
MITQSNSKFCYIGLTGKFSIIPGEIDLSASMDKSFWNQFLKGSQESDIESKGRRAFKLGFVACGI